MDAEREKTLPLAALVGLDLTGGAGQARAGLWRVEDSLDELERLAATADVEVAERFVQRLSVPNVRTLIGSGKVTEIRAVLKARKIRLVIFDDELSPRQQVNLEKAFNGEGSKDDGDEVGKSGEDKRGGLRGSGDGDIRVMDRTALILDIFALHATTREGKLQVELATLEYELPRLRGKWSHLEAEKLGGGVGARFGMGESQLETDRRLARKRISELKRELVRVAKERQVQRGRRVASGIYKIALVGYTNAGKSTLLNALTQSDVLAYDKLFATLDSTTRKYELATGRETTLTDTVGFINKLPHGLVAAFKSTLDEVGEADLLLHVVDAAAPMREAQIAAVEEVLIELKAERKPTLMVFNKADLLDDPSANKHLNEHHSGCVVVSASTGVGLDDLLLAIERQAAKSSRFLQVLIPFTRGDLVELAHKRTTILGEDYVEGGTRLSLRVPSELNDQFAPYVQ